jgi:hypothetical protein
MPKTLGELNSLYDKADTSLNTHMAEIRSNILLETGFHHPRYDRWANLRTPTWRDQTKNRTIRITKNHIQRITKYIRNSIQNRSPDGGIFPRSEHELQDRKAAELNSSVYDYLRDKHKLPRLYGRMIHNYVTCGEQYLKVFWDVKAGKFLGYDSEIGEDGEIINTTPRWEGGLVYEVIPPYNLFTDTEAQSEEDCSWMMIRKGMDKAKLMDRYTGEEDKLKIIEESGGENYQWFDGLTGLYTNYENFVQLREFYFKPSAEYPNGYFYFCTNAGVLEEGELPDGFPIFSTLFDEAPSSPRAFSLIKQIKPYQIEVNRCAASVITESIVLGHSTVLYQVGSKLSSSGIGNGLKGLSYSGAKPDIVPGRNGEQYLEYMNAQIAEMYDIAGVPLVDQDKVAPSQGNDAWAMLFRSLKDKMKFSLYGEKIENTIIDVIEYSLKLSRRYMSEDVIIPVIGKNESVNIQEFKNSEPLCYQIKIRPRSDDFSSTMGKSLQLSQILQYAGSSLPPEAVGQVAKSMPFLDDASILKDLTIDLDQAEYVILALDRGEIPFFFATGNHEYMVKRLTQRMNEPDFITLDPQMQTNYQDRIDQHTQVLLQQQQESERAKSGFIPSGGGAVSVDYYITTEGGKQQRARIPYEAVDWLVKKLAEQGSDITKIDNLPLSAQAQLGRGQQQSQNPMSGNVTQLQQPQAQPTG